MRKSNISHRYAKEKDFLIISLLLNTKTVIKTQMFENDPAYEKFTRLKQENLTISCSSLSFILLHMIMLLLFKRVHLFVSPSRQTTLNSALQRALKHFNNACSTTKGSISIWSIDVTIKLQSTTKMKFKKNRFSKQTGYTSNISISYDG